MVPKRSTSMSSTELVSSYWVPSASPTEWNRLVMQCVRLRLQCCFDIKIRNPIKESEQFSRNCDSGHLRFLSRELRNDRQLLVQSKVRLNSYEDRSCLPCFCRRKRPGTELHRVVRHFCRGASRSRLTTTRDRSAKPILRVAN